MRRAHLLILALLLAAGCNSIRIHRGKPVRDAFASWRVSATTGDELSTRLHQTLRQWDLKKLAEVRIREVRNSRVSMKFRR